MLVDRFGRTINYVRISVTDRCNLRCKYCVDGQFPFIAHGEILRYEEIIRFVRILAGLGVNKVRITGGEPLVRKGIPGLIREIASIPGIEDIGLTTNGVLLGAQMAALQEAGLKRVNISLDTMKKERFAFITGVDAFDDVLKSIKMSVNSGLSPVKINAVIIQGFNDDEILDFREARENEKRGSPLHRVHALRRLRPLAEREDHHVPGDRGSRAHQVRPFPVERFPERSRTYVRYQGRRGQDRFYQPRLHPYLPPMQPHEAYVPRHD